MRKASFVTLLLLSTTLSAHDYWCLDNRVTLYADYGYIHRKGSRRNSALVEEVINFLPLNNEIQTIKSLTSKDLDKRMGWESAIRGGVIYHSSACASLEATYTYFYPWEAKSVVKVEGSLRFPFIVIGTGIDFENADRVESSYRSRLQNGELNYWGHVTPQRVEYFSFSWNMGFRIIDLNEKLSLGFTRDASTSYYTIRTENVLYGGQLGALLELNPSRCWTWSFLAKGAAFFNTAENKVKITDENDTFILREYKKQRWTDSYLIEAYGQLAYHWSSLLSIHFGYQGFILTGVALAPDQRDIRSIIRRRIKTKGQLDVNGLYGGLSIGF